MPRIKPTLIFFLYLSFISSLLRAQEKAKDWVFKSKMDEIGISFQLPKGYSEFEGMGSYFCSDHKIMDALDYSIVNKDSSVVIAFSLLRKDNASALEITKKFNPDYDFNKNYLYSAKDLADTTTEKIYFYPEKVAKEKFNADDVGLYTRTCGVLFRKKYPLIKVVFGVKKDVAQFEITYFYTEAAQKNIDKIIKDSAGIIRFAAKNSSN